MVITKRPVSRIDLLTAEEEEACWTQSIQLAREAIFEENGIYKSAIMVNDGLMASQTIGHVHFHVLGLQDIKLINNLSHAFSDVLSKYARAEQKPIYQEVLTGNSAKDLALSLRECRKTLKAFFGEETGFSLFTHTPLKMSESKVEIELQAWNKKHASPFSLTNMLRVLNGYRETPYSQSPNCYHKFFTKEKSSSSILVSFETNKPASSAELRRSHRSMSP